MGHSTEIVDYIEKSRALDSFTGISLQMCLYYRGDGNFILVDRDLFLSFAVTVRDGSDAARK
jgi:hypothetical protein